MDITYANGDTESFDDAQPYVRFYRNAAGDICCDRDGRTITISRGYTDGNEPTIEWRSAERPAGSLRNPETG
jgi:hypothetical protein